MEVDSKAVVVVSFEVNDGSIVVEALPLALSDATEVDSVVCAILLVLTNGIVDPILPVALVWEWVDSVLALSVEPENVAVRVLALEVVVGFSADVVVSLAIDDGSIVVASLLLVLVYDIVDCNMDVELVSIWLNTVLELAVDGVKFVDLVFTLVEVKDSELLGEPTVTVVDSVACAILLVLTSGVVDTVLTTSLVWERVDTVLAFSVDCLDVSGVDTERNNVSDSQIPYKSGNMFKMIKKVEHL